MSNLMRNALRALAIMSIVPFVAACSFAQDGAITGFVADSTGGAIPKAQITIHWDTSGSMVGLKDNVGLSHDLATTTDKAGHFALTVPPGFYDVFVTAPAFTPVASKVRVKANVPARLELRLNVDPVVSRELADHF